MAHSCFCHCLNIILASFQAISISYMETGNQTAISKFILLSLSEDMDLQPLLFGLFLSMYLVCVIGNLLTILAIISDSHHYSPMYFFPSNLSFTDICFSTTTVPKMLVNIQTQNKGITYEGCLTQMYFFMIFAGLDNLPLTVMAYDRFVAICHPLYYMVIMNPRLCGLLLLLSWLICLTYSLLQSLVLKVSFCKEAEIPHFFCELAQILKLTLSDALVNDILLYFVTGLLAVIPLTGIFFSYSYLLHNGHFIYWWEVSSLFHLWVSPLSHLLVLWCRPWGLPHFWNSPSLQKGFSSLGDVHGSHPHAESLHLQPEELKGALRRLFTRGTYSQ